LADGSEVVVTLYTAVILWQGATRLIEVVGGDKDALLGTKLLEGYRLCADFAVEGDVTLTPLTARKE
jgi:predicted aspartyl protease